MTRNPIFEFTQRVIKSGGVSIKGMLMLPVYYLQLVFGFPFALLQGLLFNKKIAEAHIAPDPIFILGHYRCGTTLLQKLLASDRRFGCLTNYDALLPNANLLFGRKMIPFFQGLINLFRIKNPFFHDSILWLEEPAEEDDYLMNKASPYSAYWGLVFPRRWREWLNGTAQICDPVYVEGWKKEYLATLRYASYKQGGRPLVLKSPPNTGRVSWLLDMFPKARFVFLYRNPFHVYYSTRNMWKRAILKYYSVQDLPDAPLEEVILSHFEFLIGRYEAEKGLIPKGQLVELSYEALVEDPFGSLERIYREMDIPLHEAARSDLSAALAREKAYQVFQHQYEEAEMKKIGERWKAFIDRWGYVFPSSAVSG